MRPASGDVLRPRRRPEMAAAEALFAPTSPTCQPSLTLRSTALEGASSPALQGKTATIQRMENSILARPVTAKQARRVPEVDATGYRDHGEEIKSSYILCFLVFGFFLFFFLLLK